MNHQTKFGTTFPNRFSQLPLRDQLSVGWKIIRLQVLTFFSNMYFFIVAAILILLYYGVVYYINYNQPIWDRMAQEDILPWVLEFPLVFLIMPLAAIMLRATLLRHVEVPYWRSFLVTTSVLLLREMSLVQSGLSPHYGYVWPLSLFYAAFVAFVNVGTDLATQRFLRRAAIWSIAAIR